MAELKKVQVQLLNAETGEVIEDVNPLTSADAVKFSDGETLAQKQSTSEQNINKKADKATTIAGYGITDAYTKGEVDAKVSSVYKYKGSVLNESSLPQAEQVIGDVYNLEDTGMNVAWDGTKWDKLGSTVDLTPYITKSEVEGGYAPKTHKHLKSEITDFPSSMPANGGNADTVGGHTVETNVPHNAKFTDTTYENATSIKSGLMSVEDKKKLDNMQNVKYGSAVSTGTPVNMFLKVVQ